jgi:cation transport regulator
MCTERTLRRRLWVDFDSDQGFRTGHPETAGMPYASDDDLPPSVRNHLPAHAREIFRIAFNHAWETYGGSPRLEEIAHRVAWAAVKRRYRKACPEWVPREDVGDDRW